MGFLSKVGGPVGAITGLGFFNPASKALGMGKVFGSDVDPRDPEADALRKRALQFSEFQEEGLKGLSKLSKAPLKSSAADKAEFQTQKGLKALMGQQKDIERATREQLAQTGLAGRSSIGLRALQAPQKELASQFAQIRAQQPFLEDQYLQQEEAIKRRRYLDLISGSTGAVASQNIPFQFQDVKTPGLFERSLPGLLQLGGRAAIGA